MNLAELQQKVDRVIHNADEFVRKWMEFISAPAGTVTLEYYDKNGNLKTAKFSNRNKLVQDFIANANRVMSKTVYVDQVNGDDGNDGSANAPFKTIKKAVDSVPAGGYGLIYLKPGQTYSIDPTTYLYNKYIHFKTTDLQAVTNGDVAPPEIHPTAFVDGNNYNSLYGFILFNSTLRFEWVRIIVPSLPNPNLPINHYYHGAVISGLGKIIAHYWDPTNSHPPQFVIPRNTFPLIRSGSRDGKGNISVILSFSTIQAEGVANRSIFLELQYSNAIAEFQTHGSVVKNSAGNSLSWNDVISGIVRDSNGIPRNVISNVIL